MSAGKIKTIIDRVHYKSSEDPLRTVTGKYWSRELGADLSLFKQGFESEIGDSLTASGAPFKIIFKDTPNIKEQEQFYEFEQKIILKANSYRIAQEADPDTAWGDLVTTLVPNEDTIYSDHAFTIELPYSEKELKILNINQKVNTADIKPTYNFYIEGYEEKVVDQKIPEQMLPNLYVFTQSEINGNTGYDVQDEDLDGLINLGGQIPESMQKIMKKRKNSLNEDTTTQDNNEKYFKNYGKYYKTFAKKKKATLNRMKNRYSNISLTNDLVENISEYNEKNYIFPMFSDIRFTTDSSTYIAQILKDAGLSTPLMSHIIAMSSGQGLSRHKFVEARKKVSTRENKKLEKTVKMETVFKLKQMATLDLLKWWDKYSSDKGSAVDVSSMGIMIGQDQAASDPYGKLRNAYMRHVLETVFESKFRKFIKNYIRSYRSMLNGDMSYSETVMYKIQKFLGNPTGTPIQTFYACNSNEVDMLNILDTQVKYNTEYTYTITAYQLVLGTEYQYKDVITGSKDTTAASGATTTDYYAKMTVVSRPSLKIIEVPIFAEKERIIDDPPVAPDIDIIPYRAVNNRLLFNFMGNVGEYDLQPIFFNEEERLNYEKIRKAQKRSLGEPLRFSSDDPPAVFEVFRITKRPKSYMDFKGFKRVSVQTDVSIETIQKASTASYVERLEPNVKYYYIFRSIDIHGHISYPSAVYEVQLVDDAGAVYPKIGVVDFAPEIQKTPAKSMKKYMHIVPVIEQVLVNPEKSGLMNEYGEPIDSALLSNGEIQLGFQESPIWGKKFKVRLVSKQTGRKLDLNIRFDHEHIVTEEDYKNEEVFRESELDIRPARGRAYYSSKEELEEEQDELMELIE